MSTPNQSSGNAPQSSHVELPAKPDGPGAAIMIAAGAAVFVLGLLTVLNEASKGVSTFLSGFDPDLGVGALAGKSTVATIVYVVVLAVLWFMWRAKDVDLKKAFYIGGALGILGAIGTFPTFFQMFVS